MFFLLNFFVVFVSEVPRNICSIFLLSYTQKSDLEKHICSFFCVDFCVSVCAPLLLLLLIVCRLHPAQDKVLGFLVFRFRGRSLCVVQLGVAREARGRGAGRALLRWAAREAGGLPMVVACFSKDCYGYG